ncbi:YjfB family protein [Roseateles amylovorans]|uniref:YjfB family protein n=1 Tax=Roseateles amylovorans TaxID=2978473 RepID=A0ABY6AYP7_9BURK|nr:YjfB family protein [Roseateles amylovorans]UXH76428.1 YjfB family protein [Roseateles amylovorans]
MADIFNMDITTSSSVAAAVSNASSSTPGTVGNAASLLVLRKALDTQEAGAAALLNALPQPTSLATEGTLGRNINTYA